MSDRLAREIRTMLGPHDDTAQPVVLLVRDLVAKYDQAKAEREWTSVEDGGMPEEEGWYLCAFSDGSVESFHIDIEVINRGSWSMDSPPYERLTHWTANPAHPGEAK